jgi:hypothetical protein
MESALPNGSHPSHDPEQSQALLPTEVPLKRQKSILDKLTDHRADRASILLKNLPNEDLVHIVAAKIPAFLRIDGDVRRRREQLAAFYAQYQDFDVNHLDGEIKAKLQMAMREAGLDYDAHQE